MEGVKSWRLICLCIVLGLVIGWAIFTILAMNHRVAITAGAPGAGTTVSGSGQIRAMLTGRKWQWVSMLPLVNGSFDVPRWRAWAVSIPDGGSAKRSWVGGRFASDRPLVLAVLTPNNFSSMQQGYPFYSMYRTGPGSFNYKLPAGNFDVVFFQPRQAQQPIPTSVIGLIGTAVRGIQASQPARVTGTVLVNDWYYTTSAAAEEMREQVRERGGPAFPGVAQ